MRQNLSSIQVGYVIASSIEKLKNTEIIDVNSLSSDHCVSHLVSSWRGCPNIFIYTVGRRSSISH
ncbi:MAG: hypothetical protein ACLGGO_05450 [Coleofasciculus sp.]